VTLVFLAALVRDLVVVVFLAAGFRAPLAFFVRLAGVRRVVRVIVFVGTDPSPRVDQLREDPFHN
jgi:hypothetical protein